MEGNDLATQEETAGEVMSAWGPEPGIQLVGAPAPSFLAPFLPSLLSLFQQIHTEYVLCARDLCPRPYSDPHSIGRSIF